ncbi:hypothetical protein C2869_16440 [Saccharobesus litoralis]|uniref:DUF3450 domain-containing protein n=1 Tax=Saccharobesus litoralis TaxID=2172099 RepID=A0A2S0VUQ0_9ALTE|nr:DUF3450 domain-containing protein [Saccharobesus litoralis]AWB67913.1 hypothetical protein C2869_16440 [Saccharobesus litoralis]
MKLANPLKISLLSACLMASGVHADSTLDPVVKASSEINKSAKKSQQRIDSISDDTVSRLQQFQTVNKEIDGLKVYNGQLQEQIDNQLQEMRDLNASIDQVSVVERQIMPLMLRMIDGLEQFVKLDVPFLPEERSKRIADLRKMMTAADVSSSEKFRRVLEAYQVEVDYGRTIEAYTGLLNVEGQERDVDFLRVGRLSLIYQTRDGKFSGTWDNEKQEYVALSAENRIQITKGIRIARKQLAPDLLNLPIASAK